MHRARSIALVVLVLLAGCGTFLPGDAGQPTSTVDTGAADEPSPTPPPDRALQNPWRAAPVTVALTTADAVDDVDRHRRFLRESTAFWTEHAPRYTAFSVRFELVDDPATADVVVNATPTIARCGERRTDRTFVYCADRYDRVGAATGPSTVVIASRYNDTVTRTHYREAFAVLLGVDDPLDVEGVRQFETLHLRDPWPTSNPVVVNVSNPVSPSRDFAPLVEAAIAYWETGAGAVYRNYSVDFALRPAARDADVTVRVVDTLDRCGDEVPLDSEYTGCAPVYSGAFPAPATSEILVLSGYTDDTTAATLRHEFGHLHGRLHGQEPLPLMAPTFVAVRLPTPNATEVEQPWVEDRLRVFVDVSNLSSSQRSVWNDEIAIALAYLGDGADGAVPDVVSFELVDDESTAHVVIRAHDEMDADVASTAELFGLDVDDDDALESYSLQRIDIATATPGRHVAYHVAYWLVRTWAQGDEVPASLDGESDDRASAP